MQVTGSKNDNRDSSRLSIRIPSGQSLHCANPIESAQGASTIELWVEGAVVVPYPKALGEQLDLEAMMECSALPIGKGERLFVAEGEGAVSYALRLSAESAAVVDSWQQEGKVVVLRSPLMSCVTRAIVGSRRPKTVVLTLLDGVAYVALSNEKRLQYAEALPIAGEEELINILALLNEEHDLRKARFILLGKESADYYKTLRKYFRRVRVEN